MPDSVLNMPALKAAIAQLDPAGQEAVLQSHLDLARSIAYGFALVCALKTASGVWTDPLPMIELLEKASKDSSRLEISLRESFGIPATTTKEN